MRGLLVPVLMVSLVGCGASKLTRSEAEKDLRKDYPVVVNLHVPEQATAVKGSPEHARLVTLETELKSRGWFTVTRTADGDREKFTFQLSSTAPKAIRTGPRGFEIAAAQAEFVRAEKLEPTREGAKVTYTVRLAKPTDAFPLFQKVNPNARLGDTKSRHATYRKDGRSWILEGTDEKDRKAQ